MLHILGTLDYHDDTILKPIIKHLDEFYWYDTYRKKKDVHIKEYQYNTYQYWDEITRDTINHLRDGDTIFVTDFWFDGINRIKFHCERNNLNVKMYALHLGSSHLPGDFASKLPDISWVRALENTWIKCYDKIFVGSESVLKELQNFEGGYLSVLDLKKFVPTYHPISHIQEIAKETPRSEERGGVISPLRFSKDKNCDAVVEFAEKFPEQIVYVYSPAYDDRNLYTSLPDNLIFCDTLDRRELMEVEGSMEYVFAFAKQETFGYAVLEAVLMGCKPILINKNVYPELYGDICFDSINDIDLDVIDHYNVESTIKKINKPEEVCAKYLL